MLRSPRSGHGSPFCAAMVSKRSTTGSLFGSGLKRLDEVVTLVAASHTLEALYLHENQSRIVASNSLAFLLEHEHLELPAEAPVCRCLATVVLGLEDYERVLFEYAGGRVFADRRSTGRNIGDEAERQAEGVRS